MTLNQIFLHPVNRYISWETILHLSLKGQILLLSDGKNVCEELVLFCGIFLCWNSFLWINFFCYLYHYICAKSANIETWNKLLKGYVSRQQRRICLLPSSPLSIGWITGIIITARCWEQFLIMSLKQMICKFFKSSPNIPSHLLQK